MRLKTIHRGCCLVLAMSALHCARAATAPGWREALGEFETGATRPTICTADYAIGRHQEVSRFQIRPEVWRQYSTSRDYHDPDVAWAIASKILSERAADFRDATGRDGDGVDLYLMWNAPGQYRRANWDRSKVSAVVLTRAQRFANLLAVRSRVYAVQKVAQN